jgi:acyl-CoA reductase-like NAD-dependent aldehyde dehydrogenase
MTSGNTGGAVLRLQMTIDGRAAPGEQTFGVVNPATGKAFAQAPLCSRAELDRAFEAARAAFPDWRLDVDRRRETMLAASHAIEAAVDDIAPVLTAEQGKPLAAATAEVRGAASYMAKYAEMPLEPEVIQDDETAFVSVVRRPTGPVGIITPWNYPLEEPVGNISPALLAGNTLVIKPSPYTPLSCLMLGEILRPIFPPGVVNVVSGGDAIGAWMTIHPIPRMIRFTGSVSTGKSVAAAAATDLKRVTLELGGNDPAIVLEDADPSQIADKLFWNAFENNGQVCIDIKRLYVAERIYDDLLSALVEIARSTKVGNGMDTGVELGPVNNRTQFDRVSNLVFDAVESGGVTLSGGHPDPGPGFFFPPTILTGISDGVRVVDEEQFGPVLPVIPFSDIDDVIRRANSTHFGLGGSVWGTDEDRAWEVAEQLECGTAWVNTHQAASDLGQPFGGFKWSGIGRDGGRWGLDSFSELQTMYKTRL